MLLKTESYKKGILLSTSFNILNKALAFTNSLIVAFYFGTQLKVDIYFYAYNSIIILSAFIISLNASVLIPEAMRIRANEGEKKSVQFLNFFLYGTILLTLIISLILFFYPIFSFTIVSDFDLAALKSNRKIFLLAAPLTLLMPIVNLLSDILTSYKYFTIPMLAGIINGIFSICFVIFFHSILDILSLLTGYIFSYGINLILLIVLMRQKLAWNFGLITFKVEKRIWKNIVFALAGNVSSSFSNYLPLYMLSGFSTGIIASLNYAQQVASMPTSLITNQFSAITAIKFNELNAEKRLSYLNKLFLDTSSLLIFILVPISSIIFLYSSEIFSILFNRGAFDQKSVLLSSQFLKYLILLLPMLAINTLVARLFMAAHLIREAFWYQVVLNTFLIAFIYIGIKNWGIEGYLIALLAIYLLNTFLQKFIVKSFLSFIHYHELLIKFMMNLLINAIALLVTFFITKLFLQELNQYMRIFFGGTIFIIQLFFLNYLLNVNKHFAQRFKKHHLFETIKQ